MRVKLQLVMCSDKDHEETVTDVMTINKNNQRIEHLRLTLTEAKQLLSSLQRHLPNTKLIPFSTLEQYGKGLAHCKAALGEAIREQIERLKWSLGHGQVDKALGKSDALVSEACGGIIPSFSLLSGTIDHQGSCVETYRRFIVHQLDPGDKQGFLQ